MRAGVVVLAAGRSTRFTGDGRSKLLAVVGGSTVVRRSVVAAVEANVGRVVVVTGAQADDVRSAIADLNVLVVQNERFADGMATSLGRGLSSLGDIDAVLVGLGDQPAMRAEAYQRAHARWLRTRSPIVVTRYASSAGFSHPVLFASSIFDEILALSGDVGARSVIARDPSRVVEEPLEWVAPLDVDTIDDLHRLEGAAGDAGASPARHSNSP